MDTERAVGDTDPVLARPVGEHLKFAGQGLECELPATVSVAIVVGRNDSG